MPLRMLLAVDGSPFSDAATEVALNLLAASPDNELTVLHVVNVVESSGNLIKDLPGRLGFEPAVVSAEVHEAHESSGRTVLADVKAAAEARGREVTTVLEHGAVIERLVHWAERFELVVLGLRGETEARFPGQGGGSVHSVLSQIQVPAILVPRGLKQISAVAMGYDGSEAALAAVAAVKPLAALLGTPVHAIHVGTEQSADAVRGGLAVALSGLPYDLHVVESDVVHTALAQTAQANGANLLAMGFRGNNPLKDFLFGSSTEYIVENTELALLIAH